MAPMRKEAYVRVSVRVPKEMHEKLLRLSYSEHSSLNRTMVVAAERYIRAWEGRQQRTQSGDDGR